MKVTLDDIRVKMIVGEKAQERGWPNYAEYCFLRHKGLKNEALVYLDLFIPEMAKKPFDEQIDFIKLIFPYFGPQSHHDWGLLPHPLKEFLKPVLHKWCDIETTDSAPFRWYGIHYYSQDYLIKALEINPGDDVAREALIDRWDYELCDSLDYLPYGYRGDTEADLEYVKKIKAYIPGFTSEDIRIACMNDVEQSEQLIHNYILWKSSGHPNFEQWGIENNKAVGYRDFH